MITDVTKKQYEEFFEGMTNSPNMTKVAWKQEGMGMTTIANYLTTKGITWKDAYWTGQRLWRYVKEKGKCLRLLTNKELKKFSPFLNRHVIWDSVNPQKIIESKMSSGSTHPKEVAKFIRKEGKWLKTAYRDLK